MRKAPGTSRKRKWVRLRRRFKVTFSEGAAFTVDVSGGGFSALLLRALSPGTLVSGTIQVSERALPYGGRVIWARPGDVHLGIRSRVGVAFTSIDPMFFTLLGDEVAETFRDRPQFGAAG